MEPTSQKRGKRGRRGGKLSLGPGMARIGNHPDGIAEQEGRGSETCHASLKQVRLHDGVCIHCVFVLSI